jgi:hypothetical protein
VPVNSRYPRRSLAGKVEKIRLIADLTERTILPFAMEAAQA